jgi:hypothetical protein
VGTISGSTVLGSSLVSSSGSFVLKKYAGSGTGNILTVDTKGLVYDATNKRVGVGTAAPETTLETIGTMSGNVLNVSANASVFGTLTASGAVRLDDDLTINDDRTAATDATFTFGNATANQTLKFIHATQKFRFSTPLICCNDPSIINYYILAKDKGSSTPTDVKTGLGILNP